VAKPRRKHIKDHIWLNSPVGCLFYHQLSEALGSEWGYTPYAYDPVTRAHRFLLAGTLGEAELVEFQEAAAGAVWRTQVNLLQTRWTLAGTGLYVLTFLMHRPDPALYEQVGEPGPPAGLTKVATRRWWDDERERVGARDTLTEEFWPEQRSG